MDWLITLILKSGKLPRIAYVLAAFAIFLKFLSMVVGHGQK